MRDDGGTYMHIAVAPEFSIENIPATKYKDFFTSVEPTEPSSRHGSPRSRSMWVGFK